MRGGPSLKEMGREMTSVKENPRYNYKAAPCWLILAFRPRQLPMNPMSCDIQSAYFSLINRRKRIDLDKGHIISDYSWSWDPGAWKVSLCK